LNRHVRSGTAWLDVYFKMLNDRKKFMIRSNKIRFKGRTFNCPYPVEEYLTLEFGDWKTPCSQKSRGKGSALFEPAVKIDFNELVKADFDTKDLLEKKDG